MDTFIYAYEEVITGSITEELSPRQIFETYPHINANNLDAFHSGMTDALAGDPWRYDRIKNLSLA